MSTIDTETPEGPSVSTRSVGLKYGIFMGIAGIAYFVIMQLAGLDMSQGLWRWASFIYIFGILYLAMKNYKENSAGYMTLGQGVGISLWAGIVSSVLSSVFTYIYITMIDSSFVQNAIDQARAKMESDGKMSEEQIDMAMNMTAKFMTPTSFLIFGIVFGIIFIVIAGLITAAVMQKRSPERI